MNPPRIHPGIQAHLNSLDINIGKSNSKIKVFRFLMKIHEQNRELIKSSDISARDIKKRLSTVEQELTDYFDVEITKTQAQTAPIIQERQDLNKIYWPDQVQEKVLKRASVAAQGFGHPNMDQAPSPFEPVFWNNFLVILFFLFFFFLIFILSRELMVVIYLIYIFFFCAKLSR